VATAAAALGKESLMLKTPKRLLVVFSVVAPTMLVMSAAFACTLLVGSTQQWTPAAGEGEQIQAMGEVVEPIEDQSPQCEGGDDNDDCTYDYIVVDPDVFPVGSDTGPGGTSSCHYDKTEYGIADDNVSHTKGDAVTVLKGEGPVPSENVEASDNGSDNGQGLTVTCFVSEEPNLANDGPATATQPAPFFKTS
jgi:hypothetical protein